MTKGLDLSDRTVVFTFSEDYYSEVEMAMLACRISSKAELINNALTLFQWAVRESAKGRVIAAIDEDAKRYREIYMPSLAEAQKPQMRM